jgi:hypothetical protein
MHADERLTMAKRTTDYRSALLKDLREPEEAAQYLSAARRDSDEMFAIAVRDVAEALGKGSGIVSEE